MRNLDCDQWQGVLQTEAAKNDPWGAFEVVKMTNDPRQRDEQYTLTLRTHPEGSAQRLRLVLKTLLRKYGFKCTEVREVGEIARFAQPKKGRDEQ